MILEFMFVVKCANDYQTMIKVNFLILVKAFFNKNHNL